MTDRPLVSPSIVIPVCLVAIVCAPVASWIAIATARFSMVWWVCIAIGVACVAVSAIGVLGCFIPRPRRARSRTGDFR